MTRRSPSHFSPAPFTALLFAAVTSLPVAAHAGHEGTGPEYTGPPRIVDTLPLEDFSPHFLKEGQASETWSYFFCFPGGYSLLSRFTISNAGPGKHRGLAVGVIRAPDGKWALLKNGRSRKDWSYSATDEGPELRIARHVLRITPPGHFVHMENSRGIFTVEAVNGGKIFDPGRIAIGDKSYMTQILLAPRLTVKGTFRFPGEEEVELGEGRGVALYTRSNLAVYRQAVSRLLFHTFDRERQMSLIQFTAPENLHHRGLALLLLMEGDTIIYHDLAPEVKYTMYRTEQEDPQYAIPLGLEFRSDTEAGRVEGKVALTPLFRFDWLEALDNWLLSFAMRRFSHPVQYEFQGKYEFETTLGGDSRLLQGEGAAVLHILNQPSWSEEGEGDKE